MLDELEIDVYPFSNAPFLHQIFLGFDSLAAQQRCRLKYRFDGPRRFSITPRGDVDAFSLIAAIKNGPILGYEAHDSAHIAEQLYNACDFYFKRSYSQKAHGERKKMFPLGLNMHLTAAGVNWPAIHRAVFLSRGLRRLREFARAFRAPGNFVPSEADLMAIPIAFKSPKILFLTRTWAPYQFLDSKASRGLDQKVEDHCIKLNDMRAECIRRLQIEFGDQFIGGLARTDYALKHYPDVIVPSTVSTQKRAYLRTMAGCEICISTEGLHQSTGWKFAEYVACGRAIVCEPMAFESPGNLRCGKNYLEFTTPEQCVAAVKSLVDDGEARASMMQANRNYYLLFGSSEAIVRNSLIEALKRTYSEV